jgi:hypothetical protein
MIKFKMHPSGCAIVEFKTSDGEAHQVEADICQQVFTHRDDENVFRHFPVDTMFSVAIGLAEAGKSGVRCVKGPLEPETAAYMRTNQGIEQERIDRLCPPYLDAPLLAIDWGDKEGVTIIDGNHRYVKKSERGDKYIDVIIFDRFLWEQFLCPLPDDPNYLTKYSGVIEREQANGSR